MALTHTTTSYYSPIIDSLAAPWQKEWSERGAVALTHRECDIARLIVEGLSPRQIATRLGVTNQAVIAHRTRIRSRLGCKDDSGIVQYVRNHL